MTSPGTRLAPVAHPEHWFKAAAATGAACLALATIAATLHGSASAASYWKSPTLYVAYALAGLAVIFFFLGTAGCRFPLAADTMRKRQRQQDTWAAPDDDRLAPSNSARPATQEPAMPHRPRSDLREALDLSPGPDDLGAALRLFDIGDPARPTKHSWCVKCGFPFTRPQNKATCIVDRAGENWCKRRAHTAVAERQRHMARNAATLYRVHPEWAAGHDAAE